MDPEELHHGLFEFGGVVYAGHVFAAGAHIRFDHQWVADLVGIGQHGRPVAGTGYVPRDLWVQENAVLDMRDAQMLAQVRNRALVACQQLGRGGIDLEVVAENVAGYSSLFQPQDPVLRKTGQFDFLFCGNLINKADKDAFVVGYDHGVIVSDWKGSYELAFFRHCEEALLSRYSGESRRGNLELDSLNTLQPRRK